MSLETVISGLVTATKELTSEVANKMKGIDQKVDQAVKDVPQAILDNMGRRFWLSADQGDNSNDGLHSNRPLATIGEALRRTPAGAALEIRIMSDYEMQPGDQDHRLVGNQLLIRPDNLSERFTIRLSYYFSANGDIWARGIESFRNSLINIVSTDLEIPYGADMEGRAASRLACFFPTHSSTDLPAPLSIRLANCQIKVEEPLLNPMSLTTGAGLVMLSTHNVSAPQDWLDRGRLMHEDIPLDEFVKGRVFHHGGNLV